MNRILRSIRGVEQSKRLAKRKLVDQVCTGKAKNKHAIALNGRFAQLSAAKISGFSSDLKEIKSNKMCTWSAYDTNLVDKDINSNCTLRKFKNALKIKAIICILSLMINTEITLYKLFFKVSLAR